jgi:hypothetical protein
MHYLWHHMHEFEELRASGDNLITDSSDRYACGFPLPTFQRSLCWTPEQESRFIESAWLKLPIGSFTVHAMDWGKGGKAVGKSGWLIDGQQRLTTLERYWKDAFPVFGLYYSELNGAEQRRFKSIKFPHFIVDLWDEDKIRDLYDRLAFGGTAHSETDRASLSRP